MVEFNTNQVTSEMQGLDVSGILMWTIYREKDGPMKAYKNLGNDLCEDSPNSANEKLVTMSNAIVRNCIANSTIDKILKNRRVIVDAIRKEMSEVVKGWGVWIESIEITEVKIMSATLFKDLQNKFRERTNQAAQMDTLTITNEIESEKLKAKVVMNQKTVESNTQQQNYKISKELEIKEEKSKINEGEKKIELDIFNLTKKTEFTNNNV